MGNRTAYPNQGMARRLAGRTIGVLEMSLRQVALAPAANRDRNFR